MLDSSGRSIQYLRLSLTERCTLRCAYCRAEDGECPKCGELAASDIHRIAGVLAGLGVNKIRLTGGEPMLRKDLTQIITLLSSVPGIGEIAMTTNAQMLAPKAAELKAAGLGRVNISLDSLKPERFQSMTGGGKLDNVLYGIEASVQAGLFPIKVNVVLMRGVNDDEIDDFILLARDKPLDVRFIELMPMGEIDLCSQRIPSDEILSARPWLQPLSPRYAGQPSQDYAVEGYMGRVGLISPMSHKFCGECNRVRVMSDGMLRPCLGDRGEVSLLEALRQPDDEMLRRVIQHAIYNKPVGHSFDSSDFQPGKNMSRIGG